jgi:hypothetical protein
MPGAKVGPYWYDLNNIIKALIREIDKTEGPDWSLVFALAQDLMALSYTAKQQPQGNKE